MRALALLAALFTVVAHAENAAIDLRLVARNAEAAPSEATVTLTSTADRSLRHTFTLPGRIELPAGVWEVEFSREGWWADRAVITIGDGREETLNVWRTTRVRGQVMREQLPDTIDLVVESAPDPATPPAIARGAKFSCPVDKDGRFSCDVPATTLDLVLRAKDATPHYRWNVDLDKTRDLGTFALKRGASVLAWLSRDAMQRLEQPARARLLRMVAPEPSAESARAANAVAEATFDKRGAAQLAPVAPGAYILEVQAKGFARARVHPVEVHEARESVIRKAIDLHRPLTISVTVTPPRDPDGQPWHVELARANDFRSGYDPSPPTRKPTDDRGLVRIPDQSPGRFRIHVTDARNNRVAFRFVDVTEHTRDIHIELPLVEIGGVVTLGDEPLAATLWFGGRHSGERVKLTSDNDGGFNGWLPRGGRWIVDIESGDIVGNVDVEAKREVAIRLPDTRISGSVVDESGNAVAAAFIQLSTAGRGLSAVADRDGRFTIRGIPEGVGMLAARDRRTGNTSAELRLDIDEGQELSGLVLRLDGARDVTGRITTRGTPLAGARVGAYAIGSGHADQRRAVSQIDGTFRVLLPDNATRALIVVAAPARSLQVFDIALADAPLALDVAPAGGTLVLQLPRERQYVSVVQNGTPIPSADLDAWIHGHGLSLANPEQLQAPNLAPGAYRVCVTRERCAGGTLAAGGTLTLDLR